MSLLKLNMKERKDFNRDLVQITSRKKNWYSMAFLNIQVYSIDQIVFPKQTLR